MRQAFTGSVLIATTADLLLSYDVFTQVSKLFQMIQRGANFSFFLLLGIFHRSITSSAPEFALQSASTSA